MELSEAISILKQEKKIAKLYKNESCIANIEAIDTVLKALGDSIPKKEVKEKIKERENKRDNEIMSLTSALFERDINLLKELLGE